MELGNLDDGIFGKWPTLKSRSIAILPEVAESVDPEFWGLAYSALIKLEEYSKLDQAVQFAEHWPQYSAGGTEYCDVYDGGGPSTIFVFSFGTIQ